MLIFSQNAISVAQNIIKKKCLGFFDDVFNFLVQVTRKTQWLLHSTHVRYAKYDFVDTVSYQPDLASVRLLDGAENQS